MSNLLNLLHQRRMCRSYLDKAVPQAHLLRILEAARKSPSAGHSQGLRLAVATKPKLRSKVAKLYGEEAYLAKGFRPWLSQAPVHIVVATCLTSYEERYAEKDKKTSPQDWTVSYPTLDAGKALMALYLAAEDFGLACGYLGPHAGPNLLETFALPQDWKYQGLVTLGYPAPDSRSSTRSTRRGWRDFDDTVRWLDR